MRSSLLALLLVALLVPAVLGPLAPGARGAAAAASGTKPLTGNITGKTLLAYHAAAVYQINATGGPAVAPNGTFVGNLTWFATVSGPNTTGVSIAPSQGVILQHNGGSTTLTVGNLSEVVTITVQFNSTYNGTNATVNESISVHIVQPYVLSTTLINLSNETLSKFPVLVYLDGVLVGNVSVPTMLPHGTYPFSFQYATEGLGPGSHTFTIVLSSTHGLVRFPNGQTTYSVSFSIPTAAPDYTIWYVAGAIAFFGALFIFAARVGARRRGAAKK